MRQGYASRELLLLLRWDQKSSATNVVNYSPFRRRSKRQTPAVSPIPVAVIRLHELSRVRRNSLFDYDRVICGRNLSQASYFPLRLTNTICNAKK